MLPDTRIRQFIAAVITEKWENSQTLQYNPLRNIMR